MIPISGYPDRWSVGHNQTIQFKVSSELNEPYSVRLVRITCADPNPEGPGIIEEDLSAIFSGTFPSRKQNAKLGSYARIHTNGQFPHHEQFTLAANIWPTLPDGGPQTILCLRDTQGSNLLKLYLNSDGLLSACINEQTNLTLSAGFQNRTWYSVWCSVDLKAGTVCIGQSHQLDNQPGIENDFLTLQCHVEPILPAVHEVFISACGPQMSAHHFNGKIERPGIYRGLFSENSKLDLSKPSDHPIPVAAWDFSQGISTQSIVDIGPLALNGELINCPTRAMRGSNWSGKEMAWKHAPEQYGAIHFHDDDIYDCKWQTDFEFKVPDNFRSAMYSMRIECQDVYEDIPFYVRPKTGQPQARICVIVPTFTYTVYTNQARSIAGPEYSAMVKQRGTRPWTPDEVRSFGLSTYNDHNDGSGISLSSRLRPSLTMRPNYITIFRPYAGSGMRHLPADTHLLAWLEHLGHSYDLITDDDIHAEGIDVLRPYQVVMTMSHPEYHTANTLDAIFEYSRTGGRLMYMGGNGFYWKVGIQDDLPGMVEIRRAEGGIRTWAAEPGEYYNALDGEYGGMWLRNGRPPQQLAGVGFTGQGDFEGTYYRRSNEVPDDYQWVFEGVDDEVLGDFGLNGGGAAGFELDRIDYGLGTPLNTVVLASSETYPDHFVLVPEEILSHQKTRTGDPVDQLIRSDMIIFEIPNNGFVFSVGSITYCGALPCNGFNNNISRLTQNVLERFLIE